MALLVAGEATRLAAIDGLAQANHQLLADGTGRRNVVVRRAKVMAMHYVELWQETAAKFASASMTKKRKDPLAKKIKECKAGLC